MKYRSKIGLIGFAAIFAAGLFFGNKAGKVPAGYIAKVACSEIFVAGRNADDVLSGDQFKNISPAFDLVRSRVDYDMKTVTSSFLGLARRNAEYTDDYGCILNRKGGEPSPPAQPPYSEGGHIYQSAINTAVQATAEAMFGDEGRTHPIITRAVVVIQNGEIIAEHYAPGFDKDMRQQSWSMAKGFMQALAGLVIKDGHLSLEDTDLMPGWTGTDDPRNKIRLDDLLKMASGLEFGENYANPFSDVDQMLFAHGDMAKFAAQKPLTATPGTKSVYSSGTSNIVSKILKDRLEGAGDNYHTYVRRRLFAPLSMNSALFEPDAAGTFIGSSYIYAVPRDFARFGQLYLQKGRWQNTQILPESWIEYTREPAPASGGKYGAHWSLNQATDKQFKSMRDDVISLGGNDGQMIIVIPEKNAVIVRLGVTRWPATNETDVYPLIEDIFAAIPALK